MVVGVGAGSARASSSAEIATLVAIPQRATAISIAVVERAWALGTDHPVWLMRHLAEMGLFKAEL